MTSAHVLSDTDLAALPDGPEFFEQTWDLAYRHAVGATTSRFLGALKARKLLAKRCPQCERVILPARAFCDRCHCDTDGWVEVSNHGLVEMFTIVYEPFKGMPEPPYALAYVRVDGADTALLGYVKGLDLADPAAAAKLLSVGTRVDVCFAEHPEGKVTDYWFVRADGPPVA